MMILDVRRHMELFDPHNFNEPVTVLGCGATGSWVALYLAKLGIDDITVYDFDVVEAHNVPNQAFGLQHEHDSKVSALRSIIYDQTRIDIKAIDKKYTNQPLRGVVFLMVDSMAERKRIWETSLRYNANVKLLIEPRMGLSMGRVYTLEPYNINHIKQYEKTFYSDDDAEVSACGSSVSVITSSTMIASICTRQLINWFAGEELENEILVDMQYWNIVNNMWK